MPSCISYSVLESTEETNNRSMSELNITEFDISGAAIAPDNVKALPQAPEDEPTNRQQSSQSACGYFKYDPLASDWFTLNFPMDPQHQEVDSSSEATLAETGHQMETVLPQAQLSISTQDVPSSGPIAAEEKSAGVSPQTHPSLSLSLSAVINMESSETGKNTEEYHLSIHCLPILLVLFVPVSRHIGQGLRISIALPFYIFSQCCSN